MDAHVDGPGLGLQGVEVFREGLPLPVDALGEGGAGDVLHPLHELDEEVLLARADRREADAAVAHDGGGHAVPAGGGHDGIPGGLAIVVGVDVHPAGGDNEPVGVDLAPGRALDLANGNDAVALDSDVPDDGRRARSVHEGSAPDDQVQHVRVSPLRASISPVCLHDHFRTESRRVSSPLANDARRDLLPAQGRFEAGLGIGLLVSPEFHLDPVQDAGEGEGCHEVRNRRFRRPADLHANE